MRLTESIIGRAIAQALTASVEQIPADADAKDARRSFFNAKLTLFATVAYAWSHEGSSFDVDAAVGHFVELGIVTAASTTAALQDAGADLASMSSDLQSGELSALYEQVLQWDLSWRDGTYEFTNSKTSRDSSGAYYTPRTLAREVTRHSIDLLIHQRTGIVDYSRNGATPAQRAVVEALFASVRVADLSCGAGDFLLAALDCALEYTGAAATLARNMWATDVDPIALIIAAAEIELRTGGESPHFIVGNPLLGTTEPTGLDAKVDLFATGRIYAAGMAVFAEDAYPTGGFDLILGNPPWEKIRFEERKTHELLGRAAHTAELASALTTDYAEARSRISENALLAHPPRGEANTYALFPLLGIGLLARDGVMALILKSAIATSPVNSALFSWLRTDGGLREIHLFDNTSRIFSIDSREKFCIGVFAAAASDALRVSFGNTAVNPLDSVPSVSVTDADLWHMYPSTGTLPNVRTTSSFRDLQRICLRLPRFAERHPAARFGRIVHLTSHADVITTVPGADSLPILEGKFIGPYTVRAATFDGITEDKRYSPKALARRMSYAERAQSASESRYYIGKEEWDRLGKAFDRAYMLCWRSLTSATNARTTIAAIAPFEPAVQSVQFLQTPDDRELIYLLGLFNSMAFDHLVRLMIPGIDLTQSVIRQVPVPDLGVLERPVEFAGSRASLHGHILARVEQILRSSPETVEFIDGAGASVRPLSESEHIGLTREIDELFFLAYELDGPERERVLAGFQSARYSTAVKTP
jgi:hypothetical protein